VLFNFASIVPGGMVVFLPSYGFLDVVQIAWQSSGLLDKLKSKKKVFSEPQESTQVETVLREYTCAIHDTVGASCYEVIKFPRSFNALVDAAFC